MTCQDKTFVVDGCLMAYGPSFPDMFRRAAYYVDRILKGTKPADLPVESATTFEFVINARSAKALGLTIPQSLLLRADQVIEYHPFGRILVLLCDRVASPARAEEVSHDRPT